MQSLLDNLTQNALVWRGDALAPASGSLSTGFADLDCLLPGSGWPRGAITEILLEHQGIGELRLIVPAVRDITHAGGWVVFVAPPHLPYAPALARLGINLNQIILLDVKALKDQCWAAEQALRAGSCSAVLFWPRTIDDRGLRRLQLAAEAGGTTGFVFAPVTRALQASPAPLRLKLAPAHDKLRINILKRRGSLLETPLLLDVDVIPHSLLLPVVPPISLPWRDHQRARQHDTTAIPRITKHYPNGADSKRLWDKVIARGDTVRRSTSEDR